MVEGVGVGEFMVLLATPRRGPIQAWVKAGRTGRIRVTEERDSAGLAGGARIPVEISVRHQENPKTDGCQENSRGLMAARRISVEKPRALEFWFSRAEQVGIVVAHVAHALADGPGMHFFRGVGVQQVSERSRGIAGVKPAVVIGGFEDGGHAVVKLFCHGVGIVGNDRKGFQRLAFFRPP